MQTTAKPAFGHGLARMAFAIFVTGGTFELNIFGHWMPPFVSSHHFGVAFYLQPELSDSNFGFGGRARWGLPSAWAAAKDTQASTTPPGFG
jgi:hypothetical protein